MYLCKQDLDHIKVPTDEDKSELLTFEIPEPSRDVNTVNDLKGVPFIIHDACWNILKGYSCDTPIPLDHLADVLSDTWGRYFQDVIMKDMDLEDPTEPIKIRSNELSLLGDVQEPSRAVDQQRKERAATNWDVFITLPSEMRELIAGYLPVEDFYRLRYAYCTMGGLFFSEGFWHTRFHVYNERGFLEMDHIGKGRKKWRLMYFSTNEKHLLKSWAARKKLWECCHWFRDMAMKATSLNTLNVSEGDSSRWDSSGWKWKEVESRTQKSHVKQPLVKHAAQVPSSLIITSISFFWELNERELNVMPRPKVHNIFITGIELMSKSQPLVCLGHMFPESRVTYQVELFKGFELATSQRGIHAVRLMLDEDVPSTMWVGKFYNGASITDRLKLANNVGALEASFDDVSTITSLYFEKELTFVQKFRMFSLAVGSKLVSTKEEEFS